MAEMRSRAIEELEQQHEAERRAVRSVIEAALRQFIETLPHQGLTLDYSPVTDTLYTHTGPAPRPATTDYFADDFYAELAVDTDEMIGFVIPDFAIRYPQSVFLQHILGPLYPALRHYGILVLPPDSPASAALARDMEAGLAIAG